jgi:membrane protein involved in colicin uptake
LAEAVWKDQKQRQEIFKYCPELSLIMDMKLERERCPGDDREGTIHPTPEEQAAEQAKKAAEVARIAAERKKKAEEEARKKAAEVAKTAKVNGTAVPGATQTKPSAQSVTSSAAESKETLELATPPDAEPEEEGEEEAEEETEEDSEA